MSTECIIISLLVIKIDAQYSIKYNTIMAVDIITVVSSADSVW